LRRLEQFGIGDFACLASREGVFIVALRPANRLDKFLAPASGLIPPRPGRQPGLGTNYPSLLPHCRQHFPAASSSFVIAPVVMFRARARRRAACALRAARWWFYCCDVRLQLRQCCQRKGESFVIPAKYQPVIPTAPTPTLLQHAVKLGRIGHMLKVAL